MAKPTLTVPLVLSSWVGPGWPGSNWFPCWSLDLILHAGRIGHALASQAVVIGTGRGCWVQFGQGLTLRWHLHCLHTRSRLARALAIVASAPMFVHSSAAYKFVKVVLGFWASTGSQAFTLLVGPSWHIPEALLSVTRANPQCPLALSVQAVSIQSQL